MNPQWQRPSIFMCSLRVGRIRRAIRAARPDASGGEARRNPPSSRAAGGLRGPPSVESGVVTEGGPSPRPLQPKDGFDRAWLVESRAADTLRATGHDGDVLLAADAVGHRRSRDRGAEAEAP